MVNKISVVINTCNEEKDIARAIKSVQWADEILVCDMQSDDDTAVIAKKLGAKVIFHKRLQFVEPARNFAISKAAHEWVLVMDPDEEISETLGARLREQVNANSVVTYLELPRKNMIFGKWIKASGWWPDYVIRFFKKNSVVWSDKIHQSPKTLGQGLTLPLEERYAMVHHNYTSINQYLAKLNHYPQSLLINFYNWISEPTQYNQSLGLLVYSLELLPPLLVRSFQSVGCSLHKSLQRIFR